MTISAQSATVLLTIFNNYPYQEGDVVLIILAGGVIITGRF